MTSLFKLFAIVIVFASILYLIANANEWKRNDVTKYNIPVKSSDKTSVEYIPKTDDYIEKREQRTGGLVYDG